MIRSAHRWHQTSKRLMREKAKTGGVTFGLTADVKEAHRQVPIHPDDRHLLGCQLEKGGEVFVNTVGTFGVSSASHHWSRVSAVGRLTQYLISPNATTWIMLLADDYRVEVGGAHFRPALLMFFLVCEVLGCPLDGSTVSRLRSFLLRFLAKSVEQERHSQCAATVVQCPGGTSTKVDAQASDERTGVGGWLPAEGPDGRPDPARILHVHIGSRKISSQKSFRGCSEGMEKQRESLQHWRHLRCFLQSVLSSRTLKELKERGSE